MKKTLSVRRVALSFSDTFFTQTYLLKQFTVFKVTKNIGISVSFPLSSKQKVVLSLSQFSLLAYKIIFVFNQKGQQVSVPFLHSNDDNDNDNDD